MNPSKIKFGTDGWRGVIADDFTFDNVRVAATAIAAYLLENDDERQSARLGVCIAYDSRFLSAQFAAACAETLNEAGIDVALADAVTPTPALSMAVRDRGAAGGIMITSSHNPYQWNGVKYKAWYGGSGSPEIIRAIEAKLGAVVERAARPGRLERVDFIAPYMQAVEQFVDLEAIAKSGRKFAIDSMHGAGQRLIAGIFDRIGVAYTQIRGEADPLFGGVHPEPIEPHIRALGEAVVANGCDAGLCTDGDADRIGATDEHGVFADPHKIYSVLLQWVLKRRGWPGAVTRAFNTTKMLDRICARYGRTLHEHGIGFKYVVDYMLSEEIVMGGEESGGIGFQRHLPERDGILNALLLANVMADEGRTLGELVNDLQQEYGEHQYGRIDLHIGDEIKRRAINRALQLKSGERVFAGMEIERVETLDGVKLFLRNAEAATKPRAADTWLLLRASGTEPLMRIYCESCSQESVTKLLETAREFALRD